MTARVSEERAAPQSGEEGAGTALVVAPETIDLDRVPTVEAEPVSAIAAMPAQTGKAPPASGLMPKAQSALARAIPTGAYYMTRLGPAGVSGLTALLAAIFIYVGVVLTTHTAAEDLTARIAALQHHHVVATPEQELARVVTTLPDRERMPVIVGEVLRQASAAGVSLSAGHYSYSPATSGRVARYELDFPVTAEYPKVRDFINRTLQKVPYATLDKLHVERKTVSDPVVKADVRFVVFVNGGGPE